MAVSISYVLVNKLSNDCNGCLIKKLKLKSKLSKLNFYFLIENMHSINGENEKNKQFNALIFLTLSNDMWCCLERNPEFKNRDGLH